MAKRRFWLRLLAELYALGVGGSSTSIINAVRRTAAAVSDSDKESVQSALSILAAFARLGREEYLGLPCYLPKLPEVSVAFEEVRLRYPFVSSP